MYKLPVFATLREGYGFVWRQRSDLAAFMILPVLLTTIASIFMATTGVGQNEFFNWLTGLRSEGPSQFLMYPVLTNGGRLPIILGSLATLVQIGLFITFSVAWTRRYLVGLGSSPLDAVYPWRPRHLRYGFYTIATMLSAVIPTIIFVFLGMLVFVFVTPDNEAIEFSASSAFDLVLAIAFGVATVLTVRFWLTLPASAADHRQLKFRASYKITKRNTWRMWLVIWLGVELPFIATFGGYTELFYEGSLVPVLQTSVGLLFLTVLIQNYRVRHVCGYRCLSGRDLPPVHK